MFSVMLDTADYLTPVLHCHVGNIKVYISLLISYSLAEIAVTVAHNKPTFDLGGSYVQQIPYLHH